MEKDLKKFAKTEYRKAVATSRTKTTAGFFSQYALARGKDTLPEYCKVVDLGHGLYKVNIKQMLSERNALWAGIKNKIEAELGMTPKSVVVMDSENQ